MNQALLIIIGVWIGYALAVIAAAIDRRRARKHGWR